MSKRKLKSNEFIDDSDDPDDTGSKKAKKVKRKQEAAASASASRDEEEMIPLSAKRFVSVQSFRGKHLVSIREYYDDDSGERRPGKKGISLTLEQWQKLKDAIPQIDEQLRQKV